MIEKSFEILPMYDIKRCTGDYERLYTKNIVTMLK